MSGNKTNEILTVYLRKKRVYLHLMRVREFGSPEGFAVKLTTGNRKECGWYLMGIRS